MISSIRSWMFSKTLKEHQNFREERKFSGVNHCNSYCIIGASEDSSRAAIIEYKKKLETQNKKVHLVFFSSGKQYMDDAYRKQDVKWNGIPQHEVVDKVLSKEFDIFIFLYPKMANHLKYISILSNSKFKVGPYFDDCSYIFDLLVDVEDTSNTSSLIKNINAQLSKISQS